MTTKAPAVRAVITIKEVNKKLKKDGTTPFWNVVTDGGDFYSVFKPDIEARLEMGRPNAVMVEETTSNGKTYRNITGIAEPVVESADPDILDEVAGVAPPAAVQRPAPKPTMTVVNNMADIRAQALAAAVALAAGGVIQAVKIEEQSNTFVNYILHGKDVEHKNGSIGGSDGTEYIEG